MGIPYRDVTMHEWALAESIIATVADEVKEKGLRRVLAVEVKVGELQQIDLEIFRFLLEGVLKTYDLPLDMADITVSGEPGAFKCRACGGDWNFGESREGLEEDEGEAIHFIPEVARIYMRCPICGSPDFDITQGRGVRIECIEGET